VTVPGSERLSVGERAETTWLALIGLSVQASAIAIVGPEALAEIAKSIQGQAVVFDYSTINNERDDAQTAQLEIGRLAQEFEMKAIDLLRPTAKDGNEIEVLGVTIGQKKGRKW